MQLGTDRNFKFTALGRAYRKIMGWPSTGSCIGVVPPLAMVVSKALLAHSLEQNPAPALLLGANRSACGMAGIVETVITRAHVDAVIGTALCDGTGTGSVSGFSIERSCH